ncbi:MAG: hypothetical protein PVJ67_03695 [Candidatus Pacearchaeota archaeon]|jgi:hypothetical protein
MRSLDIIKQLRINLPKYTNYFTDEISIVQITSSGLVATVETSAAHGLITGNYVHISGTLVPNDIILLESDDHGIATATTSNDHDQTESLPNQTFNIEIIDADQSEYNGSHELLTVSNRRNITYSIEGTPITPATGAAKLLEDLKYGYNGWHQITYVDDTHFTFSIQKVLGSPAYGTPICRVQPRISGGVDIDRILDGYTKQDPNKLWAFSVLSNRVANKDRQTMTDATVSPGKAEAYRQLVIQPISIYVPIPATTEIAARAARDLADELLPFLCRSLLRTRLPSGFDQPPYSGIVFSGDNFFIYNHAYYVHEFTFETTEYITYYDTIDDGRGVAFRDIDVNYLSSFNDEIFMTDSINLDDIPL